LRKDSDCKLHTFETITSTTNEIIRLWFKELKNISSSSCYVEYVIVVNALLVATLVNLKDIVTRSIEPEIKPVAGVETLMVGPIGEVDIGVPSVSSSAYSMKT
jgi:hypothetical protein